MSLIRVNTAADGTQAYADLSDNGVVDAGDLAIKVTLTYASNHPSADDFIFA
ncbi:MAG: hypothetical protein IPK66_10125 [Rhodospirillales bacterium]|nr:hypothetical protein [Rhodospirillales bacterium]